MRIRVVSATVLQAYCCKLHRKWAAGNLGQHHRKDTSRACPAAGPQLHSPAGVTTFVKFDTFDIDYSHTMMYLDPKDASTDGQLQ